MKKFIITTQIVTILKYEVEAESADKAYSMFLDDDFRVKFIMDSDGDEEIVGYGGIVEV